ncbi:hypothetical protein FGO68_gene17665 [Halteria grandinella]|uniref:Uncharacterized protein n=1 Tax=Halteria grandinella TaxID=5974 RepID=A0A8J8P581_HALGN|nr:hypothetical protein FGO68_gene17665 [Halteria grandinella]
MHGFFENQDSLKNSFLLLVVENSTHIIDFAKLTFVGGETVTNLQLQQYREVVALNPSQYQVDPIQYFKMFINYDDKLKKEKSVVSSFRQSGRVDFYYDYELIDSSLETYARMEMNSKYIYLKKKGEGLINEEGEEKETVENCIEIDQDACQRIGESVGTPRELDPHKWHFIIYDLIRNHARIYTAMTLVNVNFFVAFNQVVAVYDVVRKEWKPYFFKQQVFGLLRNQVSDLMHELNVGEMGTGL